MPGTTYTESEGPEPFSLAPKWITIPRELPPNVVAVMSDGEARGGPFLSLWSVTKETHKLQDASWQQHGPSGSIRVPLPDFSARDSFDIPRVLPLRPLWPGFAINTIFYAALLWVLWIAPGKIRRFIRIRRHRCPACGYQIDSAPGIGPVCSECGAALPAAWSTSASS
jgi:hypothetical protein